MSTDGWMNTRGSVTWRMSAVILLTVVVSCTRSINVTESSLTRTASYEGLYRIETRDDESFTVRKFSINDSTLVINQLNESDKRYGTDKLPVVVDLAAVRSVSRLHVSSTKTALLVLAGASVVIAIVLIASFDVPSLGR